MIFSKLFFISIERYSRKERMSLDSNQIVMVNCEHRLRSPTKGYKWPPNDRHQIVRTVEPASVGFRTQQFWAEISIHNCESCREKAAVVKNTFVRAPHSDSNNNYLITWFRQLISSVIIIVELARTRWIIALLQTMDGGLVWREFWNSSSSKFSSRLSYEVHIVNLSLEIRPKFEYQTVISAKLQLFHSIPNENSSFSSSIQQRTWTSRMVAIL